jgi:predicted DNA-binding transcriptional regulator AlpA
MKLEPLIDEPTAAAILGVTRRAMQDWRLRGNKNLPVVKIGRLVRYKRSDIAAMIEKNTVAAAEELDDCGAPE